MGVAPLFLIFIVIMAALGGDIKTSGYVENNFEYAAEYKEVLNKYLPDPNRSGYVSLSRIIFFYQENPSLTFDYIYKNNICEDSRQMKPIGEVCSGYFKDFSVCWYIDDTQIDEYTFKPFNMPLDYAGLRITSYFGHDRIVNGREGTHWAWDFANNNNNSVYSVCNGTVTNVNFPYKENIPDLNGGCGNIITIECDIDNIIYTNHFCHLFPNSAKVKVGDRVRNWQEIARYGNTGYSFGNHLHWQTTINGTPIDGMDLVNFELTR